MSVIETKEVAAPIEAAKEVSEQKPVEQDQKIAQMARREKILVHKSRELARREQELKAREEAASKVTTKQEYDWKGALKQNPLKTLEEAGLPYDQLVETILNINPMDHNFAKLAEKIAAIEEGQKTVQKQIEERDQRSYDQAIKQVRTEVKQAMDASPEQFEVLKSYGDEAQDAVVKLIEKTFETEGYVMDVDTAAQEVEDYLLERTLALAKLKKVQAKLTPSQQASQQEVQVPPNKTTPRANTLTHTMTSSTKRLTDRERRERAILAFQGKLT